MRARRVSQMFATSLANGLSLLSAFTAEDPRLSNASLARRTGLSRATVTRLTFTLCELGLLSYDAAARQYRIGSGAVSLAYPFLVHLRLQHVALPMMQGFANRNGTSVSLAMRSGNFMVYVDSCRTFDGMQFKPDAGASLPLLRTAAGRAWFAAQAEPERRSAMRELRLLMPSEWRRCRTALRDGVASCEARGYCVNRGEVHEDMHAVAVPLRAQVFAGAVILNSGLPAELSKVGALERVGERLVALARRIDAAWLSHA
jgi:DNA-binding IclR family transcriptional regulator